jgi:hypothetical protein
VIREVTWRSVVDERAGRRCCGGQPAGLVWIVVGAGWVSGGILVVQVGPEHADGQASGDGGQLSDPMLALCMVRSASTLLRLKPH